MSGLSNRRKVMLHAIGITFEQTLQTIGQMAVDDVTHQLSKCTDEEAEDLFLDATENSFAFMSPYCDHAATEYEKYANSAEGAAVIDEARRELDNLVNTPGIEVIEVDDEEDGNGNLQ